MRQQWILIHLERRVSIPTIAKWSGYHENTLYNWKTRYLENGIEGLKDQSRAPHSHPNKYSEGIKDAIRSLRKEALREEKRYLNPKIIRLRLKKRFGITASASGIGKFLSDDGLIPEKRKRRIPKKERIKKCKIHEPGEVAQMDVKYAFLSHSGYWFYQYSAIDYLTDIAYADIYEIQSNLEGVLFTNSLVEFFPFEVRGIQTDNHSTFTNRYTGYQKSTDPSCPRLHCFDLNCQKLGITHYLIDKGKPAQNGKVERFHRTCEDQFYQKEIFKDLNSARKKLRDFLYYYNNERENLGLDGLTPLEKLQSFPQYERVKEII